VVLLGALVCAGCGSLGRSCLLSGAKKMRTYVHWTTKELRLLKAMHADRIPSCKEMIAALPRHSEDGIRQAAMAHKLRPRKRDWLGIADRYWRARHMSKEIA
jgi:hypothetical protein